MLHLPASSTDVMSNDDYSIRLSNALIDELLKIFSILSTVTFDHLRIQKPSRFLLDVHVSIITKVIRFHFEKAFE